jgi:hypothetical protein
MAPFTLWTHDRRRCLVTIDATNRQRALVVVEDGAVLEQIPVSPKELIGVAMSLERVYLSQHAGVIDRPGYEIFTHPLRDIPQGM